MRTPRTLMLASALAVGAVACAPAPVLLMVPTSGVVASVARIRVSVRLERHKHGQGFTLGYYAVRVQEGALVERHTMEIVRDEDWYGEMPLGAGRVVQLLGLDAKGAVRVRIIAAARKNPSRDDIVAGPLPAAALALRPQGAPRGNRSLLAQNGVLVLTEGSGRGESEVRVVIGELSGQVLDARLWKPRRR